MELPINKRENLMTAVCILLSCFHPIIVEREQDHSSPKSQANISNQSSKNMKVFPSKYLVSIRTGQPEYLV